MQPPTEVVVVMQSDLTVPGETDGLQLSIAVGASAPQPNGVQSLNVAIPLSASPTFPAEIGIDAGPMTANFSMTAQLLHGLTGTVPANIVVSRSVTDVQFVAHTRLMLVLPLMRACACQGTTCPGPGNPDCDAIVGPTLQPVDPALVPPGMLAPFGTFEISPPASNTH